MDESSGVHPIRITITTHVMMMFYRYMNPDLIHILNFLLNYSQTSTNTTQKKHINTHSRNQFFEPNVSILTYQRKGCD